MKRALNCGRTALMAALCVLLFTTGAVAQDSYSRTRDLVSDAIAGSRTEKVVYLHGASNWTEDDLVAVDAIDGTSVDVSCLRHGLSLGAFGAGVIRHFDGELCGQLAPVGLADVKITGDAAIYSQAVYRDPFGSRTLVRIPPLTHSFIPASVEPNTAATLAFSRITNGAQWGRATYIAFFSTQPATIDLALFNGQNERIATERVYLAAPFTFYPLATPLEIGRVEATRPRIVIGGCPGCVVASDVYMVAFVGFPDGGSPFVEIGAQHFSSSQP
jgi:hypothetical protein